METTFMHNFECKEHWTHMTKQLFPDTEEDKKAVYASSKFSKNK